MSLNKPRRIAIAVLFLLAGCASQPAPVGPLHRQLLTLDGHLDTPMHFGRPGWDFGARHDPATEIAQLDLPRMADGNLDGGFFAIFTEQGPLTPEGYAAARTHALARSALIDTTLARYPARIGAATGADDALRLNAAGKLAAFKSIENSYPFGESVAPLAEFQRQGVRLVGIVHSSNNQFADSSTDKPRWNGLSPLGREWVREMNRLGMVIDASHASDATLDQMLALSNTPLLLSHSNSRTSFDHPRNLDDEHIRKVAAGGGAICASTIYLSPLTMSPEREQLFGQTEHMAQMTGEEQARLTARWRELDKTESLWATSFDQYIASVLHLVKVAGIDHVCMGADFDGGGGFPGLDDITALPRVTARLKAEGMSDDDLAKLWSGNMLRVLQAAEQGAASVRR
ncbi:dipeptidase [Massilia sp. YIM B02443]|uniref:dipeptidase n=1 Tax=Massilia sp. YIM B02443 TaxID=3050127 RepID=UPI0025B6E268|nr:dipeptidase [Massilia sp. YIM B02443]MDN4035814.1 dipeptidase [Massilia sp. YIM B02443]